MALHERSGPPDGGARTCLADRLASALAARFVGRRSELDLFRTALADPEQPYVVLLVDGPGGIGKTTLLRRFAAEAARAGRSSVWLDARHLAPRPEVFLAALRDGVAEGSADRDSSSVVGALPDESVLLIDGYEAIAALDPWLRDRFLPTLPRRCLVVIAGRGLPADAWIADPRWQSLQRVFHLRPLVPDESRDYLSRRGIHADRQPAILSAAAGHPLALSMIADAIGEETFSLGDRPDIVQALLRRVLDDAPDASHRLALYACATLPALNESALAAALDGDAGTLFEWLGGLSCVENGARGLLLHDLARDVLCADLRWRNPELLQVLNGRLLEYLYGRLRTAAGAELLRIWFDVLYVQRFNEAMRPYFDWSSVPAEIAMPMRPGDDIAIGALVDRHEGAGAARVVRHWIGRQPKGVLVFVDASGVMAGFLQTVRVDLADAADRDADPALAPVIEFMGRHGPARPGEEVGYTRFWMGERGQNDPATLNVVAAAASQYWTTQPRLAWTFVSVCDPVYYEPLFASLQFPRLAEADFTLGDWNYGVFGHDWRAQTPAQWLRAKIERASHAEATGEQQDSTLLVLSEAEFADAVHQALRDYASDERLAASRLLRVRLVPTDGAGPRIDGLRAVLCEAIGALDAAPRDRKLHQALVHTYLEPEATQERVAEKLGLPFNTYRYRLEQGERRVVQWLWRRELGT